MTHHSVHDLIREIISSNTLISTTLSSPLHVEQPKKIVIRPLIIKKSLVYQCTEQVKQQAIHRNLSAGDCELFLIEKISDYKQTIIHTSTADYHLLSNKKGTTTILKKPSSQSPLPLTHNREKNYLIKENEPVPFLIELGVMSRDGKVHAQKRDKFRQINRFLEIVEDILSHLDKDKPLHIVDFGSGKSYLTFALYHYLKIVKGFSVTITGVDLKADVIAHCQALAQTLHYTDLSFVLGDINQFEEEKKVNMVVSLHACDTATDAALEKAVRWKSDVILCVPCCQHELFNQIHNEAFSPLLKHGILKERFSSLVTDAARAQLLEVLGYSAQVLEFIDMEHTPKNLLIRAIKREKSEPHDSSAWKNYLAFKKALGIHPSLEQRFSKEF